MKHNHLLIILTATLLCSCSSGSSSDTKNKNNFKIILNEITEPVDLHSSVQKNYIDCGIPGSIRSYALGIAEMSKPTKLNLNYTTSKTVSGPYYIELSKDPNFADKKIIENEAPSFNVTNLELNTKYYWRGLVNVNGEDIYSSTSSFMTADTIIRNLDVDGVTNVRDVGGYETFGKFEGHVKQGLIYRCGRLNVSNTTNYLRQITNAGIDTMLNDLHIKSEIDLRLIDNNESGCATESPLGSSVNYYPCPMTYEGNLVTSNLEQVANIFHIFADESNYPLCFHCNIGTDRTGAIAYLLLGYLGVDLYDIDFDYLFSNFGNIGSSRSIGSDVISYRNIINKADSSSLQSACEKYLLNIGVTQAELDSIASIMIGD